MNEFQQKVNLLEKEEKKEKEEKDAKLFKNSLAAVKNPPPFISEVIYGSPYRIKE